MNIDKFFQHWGLRENPFVAEEARDDQVYKRIMDQGVAHPEFEKIFGHPAHPTTSVVFGEKGSGKTALRLLMEQRLKEANEHNPTSKTWIVRYDEWNHMVDRTVGASNADKPENFKKIRLEDHIDKLISLVVTEVVDAASRPASSTVARKLAKALRKLPRQHRLDLAYLAILFDQPSLSTRGERWKRLCRILRVKQSVAPVPALYTAGGGAMAGLLAFYAMFILNIPSKLLLIPAAIGPLMFIFFGYMGFSQYIRNRKRKRHIQQEIKVVDHPSSTLMNQLGNLRGSELDSLPLPTPGDQDCRYELMGRLLRLLKGIDFVSLTVLVDRVDEPTLVNGDATKMRNLIWPLFTHKFLQQDGLGIKMLLPIELGYELKREDADFYRRARLDKSNLIERLEWTGVNLFDVCNSRMKSVYHGDGQAPGLENLFDDQVTVHDLVDALDQMKQPRDAFKFLYELIVQHCKGSTDSDPVFRIPKLTLDQVRRHQSQRVQDLARGYSAS